MDRSTVEHMFDQRIKAELGGKIKNTVLSFVLTHERKPAVITNIQQQIRIAELDPRLKFDRGHLEAIVYTVADMFAKNAILAKEHELTTAAEAQRMQQEADKLNQFKLEQEEDEKNWHKSLTSTTVYMND